VPNPGLHRGLFSEDTVMSLLFRVHPERVCALLAACVAVLFAHSPIPAQVHGPSLISERTPDLHNLDHCVESIVRPGMTQKERALALWRAMAQAGLT